MGTMKEEQIDQLIQKYTLNQCSEQEVRLLLEYIKNNQDKDSVEEHISKSIETDFETFSKLENSEIQKAVDQVFENIKLNYLDKKVETRLFKLNHQWLKIASVLFLVMFSALGIYYFSNLQNSNKKDGLATLKSKADKTNNHITIALSDGRKLIVDERKAGLVVGEQTIEYSSGEPLSALNGITFASLTTPKGKHYQIILPDGTKVWLNASSTLTYPLKFEKGNRKVELNGEAYFEVVHNNKPFIVGTKLQDITVLGTKFNVDAYNEDELTRTTLISGKVLVTEKNKKSAVLSPGQQSIVSNADGLSMKVIDVDAQSALAWKRGLFYFENERLDVICKTLSRWYDIEFDLNPNTAKLRFNIDVQRSEDVKAILKKIAATGTINYSIADNKAFIFSQ
jgi:transmembrane sensor